MKPWSYCNLLGETLTFIKLISHWNSHFYRLFANKQRIRSPLLLFSAKHYPYKCIHFLGTPYKSMDYIPENATCLGLKHASLPRIRITSSNFIHSPLHMGIPNLHPFQLIISSCLHSIEPPTWFVVCSDKAICHGTVQNARSCIASSTCAGNRFSYPFFLFLAIPRRADSSRGRESSEKKPTTLDGYPWVPSCNSTAQTHRVSWYR